VRSGKWPDKRQMPDDIVPYYRVRDELSCRGALLFRADRLVPPDSLRQRVLELGHEGHQGSTRTKQRLRDKFWWPAMDSQVNIFLRDCSVCARHDEHVKPCRPPLMPIPLPEGPWQRVMIDIIGPMPGPVHERYGIVLVDLYSRWPEVALCQDVTTAVVIEFLTAVFSRESICEEIISDNGPQFRSAEMRRFLESQGVKQTFSSTYTPTTCGMVERLNRTIKGAIQTAKLSKLPTAKYVRDFLVQYRTTVHPATGKTPFRLMRGREARTKMEAPVSVPVGTPDRAVDSDVRARSEQYQAKYKLRHDERAGKGPTWEPGDWVRVKHPVTGRVSNSKSVQVQSRTGPLSYRLQTGERVHARRLVNGREPVNVSTPDPPPWYPVPCPQADVRAEPAVPHAEHVPRDEPDHVPRAVPEPVPHAPPGPRPVPPWDPEPEASPQPPPRRSGRAVKPPDRYSP